MNIESLERFKKELNQIREYLKHIQYVNDVAAYHVQDNDNEQIKNLLNTLSSHDRGFRTDRRIFEYKASIISLYGLIEKYVEIWIKEYLDFLSSVIPEYTQIHEKIRENHFELSLKLINTITTRESAKYQRLTKEEVLNKLNNCIVNPSKYQINADAFVLLSFYKKPILTIELNNKSYQELTVSEKTNIGVSVEPKIKDNQTFYIVKK